MTESDAVRARIVAAAERLFASGGEEATSLRAITREAGANVAAIHYHFGGRDQLLKVVLDRQVGPLNAHRLRLLDAAVEQFGEQVSVEVLLDAFLRPDLELLARLRATQVNVARFLGRSYTQPSPTVARLIEDQFQPVADRLFTLLEQALPAVERHELRLRFGLIVPVITGLFATATVPGQAHLLGTDDIEEQLNLLIAFFTPALAARPALKPHRKDGQ